jgi:hypothetical protein
VTDFRRTQAEYEKRQRAQQRRERAASSLGDTIESDLQVVPVPMIKDAADRVMKMHPARQPRVARNITKAASTSKSIRSSAGRIMAAQERVAQRETDPEAKAEAQEEASSMRRAIVDSVTAVAKPYRDLGNMAVTGGKWLIDAMGVPQKAVRGAETAARTGQPFDWSSIPEDATWMKALREEAAKGRVPYQVATGVADKFGAIPGAVIGTGAAVADAAIDLAQPDPGLSDLVAGTARRPRLDIIKDFPARLERSQKDWTERSGNFLLSMGTDPLTFVGTGAARSVGARAVPVLRRAIATSPWAKSLQKVDLDKLFRMVDVGDTAESAALVPERFREALAQELRGAGLKADAATAAARDLFEQAYGSGMRYFGAARPELQIPFTGKGLDLGAVVGDYKVRRAANAVLDPLRAQVGVPQDLLRIGGEAVPMARAKDAAEMVRREGVGTRQALDQQTRAALGDVAATGVAPKRQRQLLREIIDPDMPRAVRERAKLLDDGIKSAKDRAAEASKQIEAAKKAGDADAMKAATDVLDEARASESSLSASLSQVLGAERAAHAERFKALPAAERAWVDAVDQFLGTKLDELRAAGFRVGEAKNLISDRYFPRRLHGDVRPFELVEVDRGINNLKPRSGDLALGAFDDEGKLARMPFLRAEMDPGSILVDYAGRANAVIAKRKNAQAAARLFGIDEAEALGRRLDHRLSRGWVAVETEAGRRYVPRTMMGLVDVTTAGSAEEVMRTTRAWLDEMGVGKLIRFWNDRAMGSFKSNVLTRNIKFHMLNAANDIMQLMGAGMGPVDMTRAFFAARRALKNPAARFKLGGRTWTGEDLQRMAAGHGLPVGVDYGARVDVANAGRNLKEVYHRVSRVEAGVPTLRDRIHKARTTGPMAALTAPKRGEAFGQAWEQSSRLGTFMWRLAKGDSPARASQYTLRTLIDYGDSLGQSTGGLLLRAARTIMPFANWTAKAPGMAARIAVRAPRAVLAPDRAMHAATAGPRVDLGTPEWVDERASSDVLRPEQQQSVRKAERLIGALWGQEGLGSEADAQVETRVVNRLNPYVEAANVMAAPLNLDLLWGQLGPLTQAGYETVAGEDFFSRREMTPALPSIEGRQVRIPLFNSGTGNLFGNAGLTTPRLPAELPGIGRGRLAFEAAPGQASIIGRYAAPFLMSTQVQHLLNRAAYPYTGRTDTVGKERPVGALPEDQLNRTSLNMLLPAPLVDVQPDVDLMNQLRQARVSLGRLRRRAAELTPRE